MKFRSAFVLAVSAFTPAFAQLAPPNDAGVTLGHIHLVVKDVDAQKRFWTAMMGGVPVMNDRLEMIRFSGVYILLRQGEPTAPGGLGGRSPRSRIQRSAGLACEVESQRVEIEPRFPEALRRSMLDFRPR